MSESILDLVNKSDKELKTKAISSNKPVYTGQVDGGFRIEGTPLDLDSIAIKIYITHSIGAGIGDKSVFSNQLKSVIGDVMPHALRSEDNRVIDAQFGAKSLEARIVNSPFIIGTTASLLKRIAENAVKVYRGET